MKPYLTLHDPRRARAFFDSGVWQDDTFYDLVVRHSLEQPNAPALRDRHTSLTWAQLRGRVDGMADDLAATGLSQGDRMAIWMSNRVEVVIAFLACARLGIACNPSLHKSYTCQEIIGLLERLQADVLLTEDGWGSDRKSCNFNAMLSELPFLKKVYTPETFPAAADRAPVQWHDNPDSVAYLAFTSGTTGLPKCVMHSSNTLLANGRDLVRDWGLGAQTVMLTLSPLSHHIGWVAAAQWLIAGCQLVTDESPDSKSRLDWIIETGATYVMGVPTHAMDILQEQKSRALKTLGNVKMFYMAGSPIPSVVAEAFVKQGITPQNIYGMTENSSHQYTHPDDNPDIWVSTCGRGGKGYEVAIFDIDNPNIPVAVGQTGQVAGRGGALMLGYLGNQTATEASFNREGWFLSGDLGSLDAAGNLTIEGRLKDLIIRGGHNIYPAQIEALALKSDVIEKAAAFGVPDERLGERVCLAIMGKIEGEAVLAHLAEMGLSKYDMPEMFLQLDHFPLTASGKILKRELQAMVRRGELQPTPLRNIEGRQKQ